MTPLQILEKLFPQRLIETITVETNRYHQQQKPNDIIYNPVTIEEMYAFQGLLLAMGISSLPDIHDYLAKEPITNVSWFAAILPQGRFCDILRFLHLANNECQPTQESPEYKLHKMGPVIDILTKNFWSNYHPGRDVAIDETMIGTRCRISFIQYMPKKPINFGIKMWALCDFKSGYCLEF